MKDAVRSLGQFTGVFTIPFEERDGKMAQWNNALGGRCILLRPNNAGATRYVVVSS